MARHPHRHDQPRTTTREQTLIRLAVLRQRQQSQVESDLRRLAAVR